MAGFDELTSPGVHGFCNWPAEFILAPALPSAKSGVLGAPTSRTGLALLALGNDCVFDVTRMGAAAAAPSRFSGENASLEDDVPFVAWDLVPLMPALADVAAMTGSTEDIPFRAPAAPSVGPASG